MPLMTSQRRDFVSVFDSRKEATFDLMDYCFKKKFNTSEFHFITGLKKLPSRPLGQRDDLIGRRWITQRLSRQCTSMTEPTIKSDRSRSASHDAVSSAFTCCSTQRGLCATEGEEPMSPTELGVLPVLPAQSRPLMQQSFDSQKAIFKVLLLFVFRFLRPTRGG